MSARSPRGQSIVLFTMTMLVLGLMGLITFGIARRVRDRIESQMVADAAAYSEAVATARTFNMIAVMNRAQIAHWVALLGVESLVSWSGQQREGLEEIAIALGKNGCPDAAVYKQKVLDYLNAANTKWDQVDDDSGNEAKQQQGAAGGTKKLINALYGDQLLDFSIVNQLLAKQIVKLANTDIPAPENTSLSAPDLGAAKNLFELGGVESDGRAKACPGAVGPYEPKLGGPGGAVCSGQRKEELSAVMGSRGYTFTTNRSNAGAALTAGIQKILQSSNPTVTITQSGAASAGGSGFGDDGYDATPDTGSPGETSQTHDGINGVAVWAEDHATGYSVHINAVGCSAKPANMKQAWVMGSAEEYPTDQHYYGGSNKNDGAGKDQRPSVRHTMGRCTPYCPGVFGAMFSFNKALLDDGAANDFGQPKLYAMIERNFAGQKPKPWELLFNFHFLQAGPGTQFDNGSPKGDLKTKGGFALDRQVAIGAGLVYYHRPWDGAKAGGFEEPPNMLNPFWRATLAAPDCDLELRLKNANYPVQAAAFKSLQANGFRGIPACDPGKPR